MGIGKVCQDKADDIDEPSIDAIDRKGRQMLETVMPMYASTCWSRGIDGAIMSVREEDNQCPAITSAKCVL